MNLFPSIPAPENPIDVTARYKTLATDFESGRENRRKRWAFPKRRARFRYKVLTQEELETLWQFYVQQEGAYEPFWVIFPYAEDHTNEYVARGDASTTLFELPSIGTNGSTLVVYVDGIVTPATLLSGGGDAGADRIQFDASGGISTSSVGNPTTITCTADHGLTSGNILTISGHTGSVPDINGSHTITVTGPDTFTIPVNVTTAGSGGTWTLDPPAAGSVITADFEGQLRMKMRFAEDELVKSKFAYRLYSIGIDLVEVRS